MGYLPEDTHLWTQGETHEARHWFPSFDYPNERFTSEVTCRVPEDMTVLSNGRMVSEDADPSTGLKAVRWLQEKPHVSYLIALVAGKLKGIHDKAGDVPLGFYTPGSQIRQAQNSFESTAEMMAFFEGEIGVPYPWAQYNQVVVDDFNWGGMENTALTVLTDYTLFPDGFENLRSSQNLVAHELAHQWFGDYVTCKDWGHTWLNEGFATYYEALYDGHKHGREQLLYRQYRARQSIVKHKDTRAIVTRAYKKEMEQFSYRSYGKGGWVLHMLRSELGEYLFRRCIGSYLEAHALKSVVTEDLNAVVEALSGRSFDRFFDQWVYRGGVPHLKVSYSWLQEEMLAKVSVEQTHDLSDEVLLFALPTAIRFMTDAGIVDKEVTVTDRTHDFYFPFQAKPTAVLFDPDVEVLAKIAFSKPKPMLYAQLELPNEVPARLGAIAGLKSKKDRKTVSKLAEVLNNDPFYGVRISAAGALASMKTPEAFEALSESMVQKDARVRRQVIRGIGGFFRKESLRHLLQVLGSEQNPDIRADVLKALGKYDDGAARKELLDHLTSDSYRNVLAGAAIQAMRAQDDPAYIKPVMKVLAERESAFTSYGFGRGLGTLAHLARNKDRKDRVRDFLVGRISHKKDRVQRSAISALGTLGDPRAIAAVSAFSGGDEGDPLQRAANKTLKSLRAAKEVSVELKDLRNEVMELKEAGEKIRRDLDDLKKRQKARESAAVDSVSTSGEGAADTQED